jgi:hypothetical protein
VLLIRNFLTIAQHKLFLETSKEVDHGYFGLHNDYRKEHSRSSTFKEIYTNSLIFIDESFLKQEKVFNTLETVNTKMTEIAETFCPGDQKYLYSTIHPEYITAGIGTTMEILHITDTAKTTRAQKFHFDRKNARGKHISGSLVTTLKIVCV